MDRSDILPHPNPSALERGFKKFGRKVLSFGEDLGEANYQRNLL